MMSVSAKHAAQLTRMEAARRQTQHQLDLIDRQITRRMTALIPLLGRRQLGYRRGKAPASGAFLERYRSKLAALTAERQPEVDALTRKLSRQDAAITALLTCRRLTSNPAESGSDSSGGGEHP